MNFTPAVKCFIISMIVMFIGQKAFTLSILYLHPINHGFHWWQIVTYMDLHGNFLHLFFNALTLACFGPIPETLLGTRRFMLFYIVAGIVSGIAFTGLNYFAYPESSQSLIGASGAIYALITMFGMIFPNTKLMLLLPPIEIKAKYVAFLMLVITWAIDRHNSVSTIAHLSGIAFAFAYVKLFHKK